MGCSVPVAAPQLDFVGATDSSDSTQLDSFTSTLTPLKSPKPARSPCLVDLLQNENPDSGSRPSRGWELTIDNVIADGSTLPSSVCEEVADLRRKLSASEEGRQQAESEVAFLREQLSQLTGRCEQLSQQTRQREGSDTDTDTGQREQQPAEAAQMPAEAGQQAAEAADQPEQRGADDLRVTARRPSQVWRPRVTGARRRSACTTPSSEGSPTSERRRWRLAESSPPRASPDHRQLPFSLRREYSRRSAPSPGLLPKDGLSRSSSQLSAKSGKPKERRTSLSKRSLPDLSRVVVCRSSDSLRVRVSSSNDCDDGGSVASDDTSQPGD
eukprot:TRINITY_DN3277_c0_g1_i1.p1 TRINITY_DN3277_c0_g1~~TRINITY_DN3277_c0_g1_i1.p1  ORF type:complete len:343 (+),score=80.35 TRINITY_DN3277_c0_g1_i1:50-1030(+)